MVDRTSFTEGVIQRYRILDGSVSSRAFEKSAAVASTRPVGHPSFSDLSIGQMETCPLAVAFIDMRRATARSFWEPLPQVARLTIAVLGQVAAVVQESGGHVLGFRGDGLMAGWGDRGSDRHVDVVMAAAASMFSLDAVENGLNETLRMSEIEPVQIRAGMDWGTVCFARTGTVEASEVNIVGHAANFAAKCEKFARAWEIVVGEGAAEALDPQHLTAHGKSPRTYEHKAQRRAYSFYDLSWRPMIDQAASAISQVAGDPTKNIDPHWIEMMT
jgi:adenylate cyclase